tara:strand:+ start:12057 stop:12368 length:312 start_codon:yes stop_codon:yes gene_type:complete
MNYENLKDCKSKRYYSGDDEVANRCMFCDRLFARYGIYKHMDTHKYLRAKLRAIYEGAEEPIVEGMGNALRNNLEVEIAIVAYHHEDYIRRNTTLPINKVYNW